MIKNFRNFISENLEEPNWNTSPNYFANMRGDLTFLDNMLYVEERHLYKRGRVDEELKMKVHSLKDSGVELPIFFTVIGTEKEGALFIEPNDEIFYTTY